MLTINIGEILSDYYKRKRIYKTVLARKTGIDYQSIIKHQKLKTVTVDTLIRLSEGLGHNFLMDIAVQLPKNFTTHAPIDSTTTDEIEVLKEKIKQLETENQVLLKVIGTKG